MLMPGTGTTRLVGEDAGELGLGAMVSLLRVVASTEVRKPGRPAFAVVML